MRCFVGFNYSWDAAHQTKQPRKTCLAVPAVPAVAREPVTATVSLPFFQEARA